MASKVLCATVLLVAAAVFPLSNAFPRYSYFSELPNYAFQQAQQCPPANVANLVCKSAILIDRGVHRHVHVCPGHNDFVKVCFSSGLRRCCPGELQDLNCVSRATLNVNGESVIVEFNNHTITGQPCFGFGDAHQDVIKKCCQLADTGLGNCDVPIPLHDTAEMMSEKFDKELKAEIHEAVEKVIANMEKLPIES